MVVYHPDTTNQAILVGSNVLFAVVADGTAPLSYQWVFNGTNLDGATADTLLLTNVQPAQSGSYTVQVTNVAGYTNSEAATLTVLMPPVISAQPQGRTNQLDTVASFTVSATGSEPLAYQWQQGGTPLADGGRVFGAFSATLTVSNLVVSDAGHYRVVVTNLAGSVTSDVAMLRLLVPPTISGIGRTNGTVSVSLLSVADLSYTLEFKDVLAAPSWTAILPPQSGTGGPLSLTDTNAVAGTRFYRVRVE